MLSNTVSVGLMTYKRPKLLGRALHCLLQQTHENLEILISDNDPHSNNIALVNEVAGNDPRVKYIKQATNIGAVSNFRYVFENTTADYFMWAADDDQWEPEFISETLAILQSADTTGFAFTDFDARHQNGEIADHYPPFLPFLQQYADKTVSQRLLSYICQEEYCGKANVIYSLFRRSLLDKIDGFDPLVFSSWGGDMLTVARLLSLANFSISTDKLYHVGLSSSATEQQNGPTVFSILAQRVAYCAGYARTVRHTPTLSRLSRVRIMRHITSRCFTLIRRDLRENGYLT
jgi:glycosyltransferase involved in cell wall biosynthesis